METNKTINEASGGKIKKSVNRHKYCRWSMLLEEDGLRDKG